MNFENLPETWKVVRLGRVAEIYDNLRVPVSKKEREKRKAKASKLYPYYGANGQVDWIDNYIFDGEYLLIAEDGGFWGSLERSAYVVRGKFWVNNHAHIVKAKEFLTSNKYLRFFLNYENLSFYISGTTRGKLTQEILRSILIPIPPLPEQKRIVEILSLAEELIRKQKEAIALIDKILMAKFLEMFGDPATNPKGWEVRRLGDAVGVIMGQSPPSSTYNENGRGIPFLQGKAEFGDYYPIPTKWCDSPLKKAIRGDILISVRAPVGDVNICPFDICIGRGLAALRPKDDMSTAWFLFFFLKKLKSEIESLGGGSTFQAITKSDIENFPIPLPPIELQKQFTQIVEEFEKKREEMQKTLESLESLFKFLQKKAFTGELTAEWRGRNNVEWELPKITERQAVLLAILHYYQKLIQKPVTVTVAVKEAFLLQQEAGLNLGYKFIPYKYGPFSKEIYEDIENLEENLFVERIKPRKDIEMTEVRLIDEFTDWTEQIIWKLPEKIKNTVKAYVEKCGKMGLNELLDYVYAKYPEYTVKSKRKKRRR